MSLKLLYLSSALIPSQVANSINIMKSCHALAQLGCKVTLVAPDSEDKRLLTGIADVFAFYGVEQNFQLRKLPCPDHIGGRTIYIYYIWRLVRALQPDVVYARYLRGALAVARLGYPTVIELHSPVQDPHSAKFRRLRALVNSRGFVLTVTLTEGMHRYFANLRLPGLEPERIMAVPCGGARLEDPVQPAMVPKSTAGLNLGYAGKLEGYKGVELIGQLASQLPVHDFHLFGGNPKEIAAWQSRFGLPNLHFHGFIPQPRLPAYIAAMDACLLPNQRNPLNPGSEPYTSPLKLFDYMAQGKLILASDFPEIREVLTDQNSLLLDPEDPSAWLAAIRGISPEQCSRLGVQALRDFEVRFTLNARYRQILARIQSLLQTKGLPISTRTAD